MVRGESNVFSSEPDSVLVARLMTLILCVPSFYAQALALAMAYQSLTNHHKQRPPIDDIGPNDSIPNPPTSTVPARQLRDY